MREKEIAYGQSRDYLKEVEFLVVIKKEKKAILDSDIGILMAWQSFTNFQGGFDLSRIFEVKVSRPNF